MTICISESIVDLDGLLTGQTPTCVVSVDPWCSYELHYRGTPFLEAADLCPHDQAWARYPQRLATSFALCERIDALLWEADPRFDNLRWPVFREFHYILKITLDQLVHYADVICAANARYPTADFRVAAPAGIVIDEYGLLDPSTRVIGHMLETEVGGGGFVAARRTSNSTVSAEVAAVLPSTYSFGQPRAGKDQLAASREIGSRDRRCDNGNGDKLVVLSVASRETTAMRRSELPPSGGQIDVIDWPAGNESEEDSPWPYKGTFVGRVASDEIIAGALAYRGFDFRPILVPIIAHLCGRLEQLLAGYDRAIKELGAAGVKMAIFQSMAPFHLPNLYLRKWCQNGSVPYAVWMHGGFGATYSMAGYDVTDLRMSPYFLSYGHHLEPALRDQRSTLAVMGAKVPKVAVVGSPYNDALYANIPPRSLRCRQRILLAVGAQFGTHQFHYGFNRPGAESSFWLAHFEIIKLLSKFQGKYDIVVKDYPWSRRTGLWEKMIADVGGDQISLIVDEVRFDDLAKETDLLIVPWISTTFFESLYLDADIFVFENGDVTDSAMAALRDEAYYYSDIDCLIDGLWNYLDRGHFYTRSKTKMRNLFIDYTRKDRRREGFFDFLVTELRSKHARF